MDSHDQVKLIQLEEWNKQQHDQETQAKFPDAGPKRDRPRSPGEMQLAFPTGHVSGIDAVAISSDGRYLASGGNDGVKIWDVPNRQLVHTFSDIKVPDNAVIVFNHDNSQVFICGEEDRLQVIDLLSWKAGSPNTLSLGHSDDGVFLLETAMTGREETRIMDLRAGKEVWTFPEKVGEEGRVAISRDGKTLLVLKVTRNVPGFFPSSTNVTQEHEFQIWDVPSQKRKRTYTAPPAALDSRLILSPDGRYVLREGNYGAKSISVFEAETGRLAHTFTMGTSSMLYWPAGLRFSPDGKLIAFASREGTARVLEFPSGREIRTLRGSAINFSADGRTLVVGSSRGGAPFLYDLASGQETDLFIGSRSTVTALGMSPDGRFVAAGMEGGSTKLWDLTTGTLVRSFDCPDREPVTSVAVSSATPIIATGCRNGSAWLWELATGRQLRNLLAPWPPDPTFRALLSPPTSLAISRDGQTIVTGVGAQLALWDLLSGKQLRQVPLSEPSAKSSSGDPQQWYLLQAEADRWIQTLAFHPQGHITAVLQKQGITSWDMTTGKPLVKYTNDPKILKDVDTIAFTPEGNNLIGMGTQFAIVWEVVSGKQLRKVESGIEEKAPPGSKGGAVSSDGRFGARNQGKNIEVWDLTTGMEKFELSGHEPTKAMVFAPSGRALVTGGADGAVRLWDLENGNEIVALISLGQSEFVTITPDHYYRASKSPVRGVSFQVGDELLPFEQFAEKLNKPDIVLQRLGEAFSDPAQK
jgi:WD40 repeat protein